MSSLTLALLIFGVCYALIMTERLHKTIVALFGAALMISLGVVSQEEAFYSHEFGVDYNVVFLLIGMMVIVNIVRETGLFEVLAIWAAKQADAKPFRLLVLLAVLTAALSSMLDNVTTVLLMAPVTLAITKRLELNPITFLVSEALASASLTRKVMGLSSKRLVIASVTGAMSRTVVTLSSMEESAAVRTANNTSKRKGFASACFAAQMANTSKSPVSRTMLTITIMPINRKTTL